MTRLRKVILVILVAFITIQFFQPAHNQSLEVNDMHIERVFAVPENVKAILSNSCYDCHSNNTKYPWYSRIQPGAWFMASHVKEGKKELNFSTFGAYSERKQRNKFKSMASQVKEDNMPLSSYTLIHRDAILSPEDKRLLIQWFLVMADRLNQ